MVDRLQKASFPSVQPSYSIPWTARANSKHPSSPYSPLSDSSKTALSPLPNPKLAYSVAKTKGKRCSPHSPIDNGESDRGYRKRSKKESRDSCKLLACPFTKHDPISSPACWDFAAGNLARLKEHLFRRHEQISCSTSPKRFDNLQARERQAKRKSSEATFGTTDYEPPRADWMTPSIADKIHQRTKKGETAAEGWQRIYSVLFPKDKTTQSPYIEDIGQMYKERVRRSVADGLLQSIRSTMDTMSTNGIANELSAIKAACLAYLSNRADEHIAEESIKDEKSTVVAGPKLSNCAFCASCSTASCPCRNRVLPFLPSVDTLGGFHYPTSVGIPPCRQDDMVLYQQGGLTSSEDFFNPYPQDSLHIPYFPNKYVQSPSGVGLSFNRFSDNSSTHYSSYGALSRVAHSTVLDNNPYAYFGPFGAEQDTPIMSVYRGIYSE